MEKKFGQVDTTEPKQQHLEKKEAPKDILQEAQNMSAQELVGLREHMVERRRFLNTTLERLDTDLDKISGMLAKKLDLHPKEEQIYETIPSDEEILPTTHLRQREAGKQKEKADKYEQAPWVKGKTVELRSSSSVSLSGARSSASSTRPSAPWHRKPTKK